MNHRSIITITLTLVSLSIANAETPKPLIAIPDFINRTGDHATRVAPGNYKEKNVRVITETSKESSVTDGVRTERERTEDIYEKQLERDIEFAPGDWKLPEQASLVAADAVAKVLIDSGKFRILNRSNIGLITIDSERVFAATSGNQDGLVKVSREKNAQYLIIGAVSSFRIDLMEGKAYGVKRRLYSTRVNLDIRIVDVDTTETIHQSNPSKKVSINIPQGMTSFTQIYDWEVVLRSAVAEAAPEIISSISTGTGSSTPADSLVKIDFATTPPGADIIIDGDFAGNTPATLSIPAKRIRLRLQKQGHQAWENDVMPREGMRISPTLEPVPAPPASVTSE